jgi:predicted Zn-dependent protease
MSMHAYFDALVNAIDAAVQSGERHTSWFSAEETDFVRINRGKVRQAGSVSQRYMEIRLVRGQRHASHSLSLSGSLAADALTVQRAIAELRATLPDLADDPYLLLPTSVASSQSEHGGPLPSSQEMIDTILGAANGHDLVGLLASGPVYRAFANSDGQRNWHAVTTFNLQWSLYFRNDKAVKSSYCDFQWSPAELLARMGDSIEQLALVSMAPRSLSPGKYRAYISPAAMQEISQLLAWGAFSGRALATQQSALGKMRTGERLDPRVSFSEDIVDGVAPRFQPEGFPRPDNAPLIKDGELVGALVSPRTAREFGISANGANGAESPEALAMKGGELAMADSLTALDTGLAIGNLWYLNYSDRPACRMTGMTRFATFWVENGKVVAPVNVMRFDDTLYRMLGSNLVALTRERELLLESSTYGSRALASVTLPGALVSDMTFTL